MVERHCRLFGSTLKTRETISNHGLCATFVDSRNCPADGATSLYPQPEGRGFTEVLVTGGVEKRTARYRALRRATWVHPKEGTSWTNRSARDMMTEVMHDAMAHIVRRHPLRSRRYGHRQRHVCQWLICQPSRRAPQPPTATSLRPLPIEDALPLVMPDKLRYRWTTVGPRSAVRPGQSRPRTGAAVRSNRAARRGRPFATGYQQHTAPTNPPRMGRVVYVERDRGATVSIKGIGACISACRTLPSWFQGYPIDPARGEQVDARLS